MLLQLVLSLLLLLLALLQGLPALLPENILFHFGRFHALLLLLVAEASDQSCIFRVVLGMYVHFRRMDAEKAHAAAAAQAAKKAEEMSLRVKQLETELRARPTAVSQALRFEAQWSKRLRFHLFLPLLLILNRIALRLRPLALPVTPVFVCCCNPALLWSPRPPPYAPMCVCFV